MTGQQRNDKPRVFVHRQHGGIDILAAQIRRDCAHRNARRADKHDAPAFRHRLPRKRIQRCIRSQPLRASVMRHGIARKARRNARAGLMPASGKRNHRNLHACVPVRNSWVNVGSYSLERSYSVPRKPPTVISAVLVMPASLARSASVPTVQRTIFSSGHVAL